MMASLVAIAAIFAATGQIAAAVIVVLNSRRVIGKVSEVHEVVAEVKAEVTTSNGVSIAQLADATEGRRIDADIPVGDRTLSEQQYVDNLADIPSPKEQP